MSGFDLADRWFCVGGWRVVHPDAEEFPGCLAFPSDALVEGVLHLDGTRDGAVEDAVSAEPALIGVQDHWRVLLVGVGDEYICSADGYTL